ncbi:hypothetical protein GIB67_003235, partial [Kingdonia uniflora]
FDATNMLERLRNWRVVFVGDPIGRNQWESLLCMVSSTISDKDSIYEMNGNPITKHNGFLVYKFKDFNYTVEYYRAPFLVLQSCAPDTIEKKVKTILKLDQMDITSTQGCYFQEPEDVKMNMTVESAYRNSINTMLKWIHMEVNMSNTHVFFRTYAPVHFSLDSEFLASTSTDGSVRIWNINEGVPLTRNSDEKIECCRFSKDGTKLFLFCTAQKGDKAVTAIWDIIT